MTMYVQKVQTSTIKWKTAAMAEKRSTIKSTDKVRHFIPEVDE